MLPAKLQQKVINIAYDSGHLGATKTISVDLKGLYYGDYNLYVIDNRTRYPEVEPICTTGRKKTEEKLKKTS